MKKITCLILSAFLLGQSAYAKDADNYPQKFWDVQKDHWAFVYVADLAQRGAINGYDDGSFKPDKAVSRAEWAKIMVDAAGVKVSDNAVYFNDMANHWANAYVNAAKNYLTGYTDGTYRPSQAATREDVTVAMVRLKGYDLSEVDYSNLSKFKDKDSISNYAKGYVSVAIQNNLISGFEDNTFRGQDTLTRAEASALLYRAFQHGNADKTVTAPTEPIKNDKTAAVSPEPVQADNTKQTAVSDKAEEDNKSEQPEKTAEPAEEEQEEVKSYKVETLAKLKKQYKAIYYTYFSAQLNDSIYFIDNGGVYELNTVSGECKQQIKIGESILYNDNEYEIDWISRVFYDQSADRVLVSCGISHSDDFSDDDEKAVLIDASDKEIVSDKEYDCTLSGGGEFGDNDTIIFVNDDEIWFQEYGHYYIDKGNGYPIEDRWYDGEDIGSIFNCIEKNGKLYLACSGGVYKYDFNEMEQIIDCGGSCIGCNEKGFYVESNNDSLVHLDFSGKKDGEIFLDDIEITDRKPIRLQARKMYVNSNDEIIFYDIDNSAFRKISKNK